MTLTAYPPLRLRLTSTAPLRLRLPPTPALKLRFLPAIPGTNAEAAADRAEASADRAEAAAEAAAAGGGGGGGSGRTFITSSVNYYVATTGSDVTGDGSAGTPWASIQHAIDFIMEQLYVHSGDLQYVGFTINVADGTYTTVGSLVLPPIAAAGGTGIGFITLQGNTTTPANVILKTSSPATAIVTCGGGDWYMTGFKFDGSNTLHEALVYLYGGFLMMDTLVLGQTSSDGTGYCFEVSRGSLNVRDMTVTGTAGGFAFIKGESDHYSCFYFQHGYLHLSVDPLWINGTLTITRFVDCQWNPDAGITGTSSGQRGAVGARSTLWAPLGLSSIPGTTTIANTDSMVFYDNAGISFTTGVGLEVGSPGADTGKILLPGSASGVVTLSTQNAAGTWTFKLPTTAGTANYFLQTDGSGNTTWAAAGGSNAIFIQRRVTASPIVVDPNDEIITCNITAGSPACTLPDASTRAGKALMFKDATSQFAAHPLTITPFAGQTIDGLASLVLSTNFQSVRLWPYNDGTGTGWFIG